MLFEVQILILESREMTEWKINLFLEKIIKSPVNEIENHESKWENNSADTINYRNVFDRWKINIQAFRSFPKEFSLCFNFIFGLTSTNLSIFGVFICFIGLLMNISETGMEWLRGGINNMPFNGMNYFGLTLVN